MNDRPGDVEAYRCAVGLLARRDHSSSELRRKLSDRGFGSEAITDVLDRLGEADYIDDARFADTFAEQRLARGHGPLLIRARLRERGIDDAEASRAIAALHANWSEVARRALERRFSATELDDDSSRQQARIIRFLKARGFASVDCARVLRELQRQRLQ